MNDRYTLLTVCLVVVAVSVPSGAYSSVSTLESSTDVTSIQQDEDGAYPEMCIPPSPLENISMNASRQKATNLTTKSAVVSSTGNGTTIKEDLITIQSEYIEGSELCFDRLAEETKTMQMQLYDVRFENTSISGPWTDIEFRNGDADVMTVILPGEELLNVLRQTPAGRLLIDGVKDRYNLTSTENTSGRAGTDSQANSSGDSTENTTGQDDGNDGTTVTPTGGIQRTVEAIDAGIEDAIEAFGNTIRGTAETMIALTESTAESNESGSKTPETGATTHLS
ncbi:hypothetical protein [Natrinema halophilum]|uniref:Uncharacterized protein n=1 Tax=Natrinema halophilum TaxID=1699371 RepID=A0A7D5GTD0_9EURY|nr:hypothetical protein [Natrinema halophilum]QLG49206.1 hypothetical protein HYG82_10220 [Natrinema halophilum]